MFLGSQLEELVNYEPSNWAVIELSKVCVQRHTCKPYNVCSVLLLWHAAKYQIPVILHVYLTSDLLIKVYSLQQNFLMYPMFIHCNEIKSFPF